MRKNESRRMMALCVASLLAAACASDDSSASAASVHAQEASGSEQTLEEDFAYPYAEEVFARTGVRLIKGDGHILLAPQCGADKDYIAITSRSRENVCFSVQGAVGWLTLELPDAYLVKSDRALDVTISLGGRIETVRTQKNASKPIGEGASAESPPATVTKLQLVP